MNASHDGRSKETCLKDADTKFGGAEEFYHGLAGRHYHEGKRALHPKAAPWVMALRSEKFRRYVQPQDTVFEFGVGFGWNLAQIKCARRIGTDIAGFLENHMSSLGIEFVSGIDLIPDGTVDVVICHHTLEHLPNPAETLKQLARILKSQGRLILHVPWEKERRYSHYDPNEPNHHLYTWNAQNLGNLVSVCGFSVESVAVRRYGYDRFASKLAARLGLNEFGFRLIRSALILLRPLYEVELVARSEIR